MVANHWSNNAMVTIHRSGLVHTEQKLKTKNYTVHTLQCTVHCVRARIWSSEGPKTSGCVILYYIKGIAVTLIWTDLDAPQGLTNARDRDLTDSANFVFFSPHELFDW